MSSLKRWATFRATKRQADGGGCLWAAAGVVWPGGTFVPASVFSGAPLCAEVTAAAAAWAPWGLRSADAADFAQSFCAECRLKNARYCLWFDFKRFVLTVSRWSSLGRATKFDNTIWNRTQIQHKTCCWFLFIFFSHLFIHAALWSKISLSHSVPKVLLSPSWMPAICSSWGSNLRCYQPTSCSQLFRSTFTTFEVLSPRLIGGNG